MAEALLSRKKCVQALVETTKGTEETTGLEDVLCFDPVMTPTGPFQPRTGPGLYLGHQVTGIIEEKIGTFTCSVEMRGNGSNAMDAGLSQLLQACGLKNTSETYQVTSNPANHECVTINLFEDGIKKILYAAMGNVTFEGETGKRLMANFEFTGIYKAVADVAMPAFSPGTTLPPILADGTFSVGGSTRKISRISLNMGNNVIPRMDVNAASGLAHAMITDIDPVVTADLETELVATYDIYGAWVAGTTGALSLVLGSGAGGQITFTIPALQYREIPNADREGIMVSDITAQCNHSSGDDAVAIAVQTS